MVHAAGDTHDVGGVPPVSPDTPPAFTAMIARAPRFASHKPVHVDPLTPESDGGISLKKIAPKARVY